MRAMVILAVLGVCSAVPFIQDTPEVAAEKARFFQAYQAAQAAASPATRTFNFVPQQAFVQAPAKWTGPVAATIPAGLPGSAFVVADTADVSAARNAFFNAYNAQLAATVGTAPSPTRHQAVHFQAPAVHSVPATRSFHSTHTFTPAAPVQARWTGPVAATIPAGLPGSVSQVADTPEVAAAKNAFFSHFQQQVAATAGAPRRF